MTTLTFEHVPPRQAFNSHSVHAIRFRDALREGPDVKARGKISQRGSGAHTLCSTCNNNTGTWYAPALIEWCGRGMEILARSGGAPSLVSIYNTYPLRVLKQIITMFCSTNGVEFTDKQGWVRRYLLNRESRELDPAVRIFVFYNASRQIRSSGVAGTMNFERGTSHVFSEITFPPFGYVLTLDSAPPDRRLAEITFFNNFLYNELGRLEVRLATLSTDSKYPGDYRSREQILADRGPTLDDES